MRMTHLIYDVLADRGSRKRGQAETGGDLRLQETSGRGRDKVPSTTELIRGRSCGAESVQ